jgi:hypothetical protein
VRRVANATLFVAKSPVSTPGVALFWVRVGIHEKAAADDGEDDDGEDPGNELANHPRRIP